MLDNNISRQFYNFNSYSIWSCCLFRIQTLVCSFFKNETLAQVFSCEFCKIRKNIFFAEHHQKAASDYSSINISSKGRMGKWNCKLWYKNHVSIWATSVEVHSRWSNRFQKQSFVVFKSFVNSTREHLCLSLLACNSIKKRLQYRCFWEIYKISENTFFIEQLQWLLLRFNSCFLRSFGQKAMRLSPIHIRINWKRSLLLQKSRSS